MGMVFCRGCGKEIHESAPICPHCGAPQYVKGTAAPANVSTGLLVCGYASALLFPFAGIVIGIMVLIRGAIGHGIAILGILSLWAFLAYVGAVGLAVGIE